jgi:hypothetical protein
MSDQDGVKVVYGGWAPMGQASVTEPLHLKPVRSLLVPEQGVGGETPQILPEDQGKHLDPVERMCKEIVEGGFRPVEVHTRPFLFTSPLDGHKQLYPRGLALAMVREQKETK